MADENKACMALAAVKVLDDSNAAAPLSGFDRETLVESIETHVNEIANVKDLTSLKRETTVDSHVNEVTNVMELTSLKRETVDDSSVNEVTNVMELTSLKRETVDDSSVNEVTNVMELTSLKRETVDDSSVNEVTNVMELTSLKRETVDDSSVNEVTNVMELTSLKRETVDDSSVNEVTDNQLSSNPDMTDSNGVDSLQSPDKETVDDQTDIITFRPCCVLLDRKEVSRYRCQAARKRKREQEDCTSSESCESSPESAPYGSPNVSSPGNISSEEMQERQPVHDSIQDRIDSIINQNQLVLKSVNPSNYTLQELKMALSKPKPPAVKIQKKGRGRPKCKMSISEQELQNRLCCKICCSDFKDYDDYIEHYVSVHPNQFVFKCKKCLVIAPTISLINDHLQQHHSKPSDLNIPSSSFIDVDILEHVAHIDTEKIERKCHNCFANFESQLLLAEHQSEYCHEFSFMQNLPCTYCQQIYTNKHYLDMHIKQDHYACKICDEKFLSLEKINEHDKAHVSGLIVFNECSLCEEQFKNEINFNNHCKNDHLKINTSITAFKIVKNHSKRKHYMQSGLFCAYCDRFFISRIELINHMKKRHKVMKCITCPNNFICDGFLNCNKCTHCKASRKHVERISITDNTTDSHSVENENRTEIGCSTETNFSENHPCLFCKNHFINNCSLQIHMRRSHNRERFENPELVLSNSSVYKCPICLVIFQNFQSFASHCFPYTVFLHLSSNCNKCNKKFTSDKAFKKHCFVVHAEKSCYKCRMCEKDYISLEKLTNHVSITHNKNQVHCKICKESYSANHYFKEHIISHDKLVLYPCPFCSEYINDLKKVPLHVKSHLDIVKFEYNCEICYNNFYSENNLNFHKTDIHGITELKNENNDSSSDDDRGWFHNMGLSNAPQGIGTPHNTNKTLPSTSSAASGQWVSPLQNDPKSSDVSKLQGQNDYGVESSCKVGIVENDEIPSTSAPISSNSFQARANAACRIVYSLVYSQYNCLVCRRKFINPCSFYIHFIRIHERGNLDHPESIQNGVSTYTCQICLSQFQNVNTFLAHCSPYTYYYKFSLYCIICNISFQKSIDLENHCINIHLDSNCFKCRICKSGFSEFTQLTSHVTNYHTNCLVFCNTCQMDIHENVFFNYHLNQVHKEELNCCPYCKEVINNPKLFSVHIKCHMNNTNKNLMCEICLNFFYSEYNLKLHKMKMHSNAIESTAVATYQNSVDKETCSDNGVVNPSSNQAETEDYREGMNKDTQVEEVLLEEIKIEPVDTSENL